MVRSTHSAYEHTQRASREATHRFETAVTELALLTLQHAELNTRLAGAETAERTLADSPEMRTAEEIRLAGEAALAANKTLAETETDERNAISSAEQALSRQNLAEEKSAGFERESISKLHAASLAASAADLALAHQKHLPAEISDFRFPSAAETGLNHALAQRSKSLKLLTAREQAVTNSARDLAAAEEALRQAESAASAARAEEHTARENLEAVGATLFTSYASWQVAVWHLRPAESSSLADAFDAWLEQRDGPSPLRRAAESAHHQAVAVFAAREHTLILAATELTQNIAELDAEITRLENGETAPPPPPLTRRADRANRPGAPLWLVCDFHPEFPPASRAGLEAALQSAGLLDAWILPDGQLLAGDEDTFIVLSDSEISNPGSKITPRLCDLLIPAIDPESSAARQLSAETVSRLLSRIGGAPGESSHWVADNGAWQLGPLSGRWSKPEADFIGESTRAAARRRQLTISRARRDEANAALQENRSALARLAENRTAAATEFSVAPAEEPIVLAGYLLGTATDNVATTLLAAEAWRAAANDELHSRPTSTGVRFRFQWEADIEIRFHEIRPILLRKGELWTPVERTAVATFLQGRIAAEQTADESGSWRDHLARALDYRRWHRFVIERQQDGQWRRLNKTTYGTGSGGEKALALTLPRFAAAAAHYRGAAPTAPRLVMLDEAFAGIDPTMRAQCLGVLTQFDLDVVMTSELEWGCYATVPALSIYHLSTLPGLEAVAATRWLWNGREKRQLDHPEPQTPPPASPDDSPPPDDLLSADQ